MQLCAASRVFVAFRSCSSCSLGVRRRRKRSARIFEIGLSTPYLLEVPWQLQAEDANSLEAPAGSRLRDSVPFGSTMSNTSQSGKDAEEDAVLKEAGLGSWSG